MKTLHLVPGDSAVGSLRCALRDAGLDDEVLGLLDDPSCGPIASEDPTERARWWGQFYDERNIEADLNSFWSRALSADERLVVWFSRHRASELAFLLALADRLGDRPYEYIDVTGRQFPRTRRDGSVVLGQPMQSLGIMNPDMLRSLLGSERPASAEFQQECSRNWRRLKAENAAFRIVTEAGMASAPADHFDSLILERATTEWRSVTRIIGETMGYNDEPYMQVGDVMLQARIVALVAEGKLLADGDPWDRRSGRVRIPS